MRMLERKASLDAEASARNSKLADSNAANADEARSLFAPALEWLISLVDDEWRQLLRGSAMKRARRQGILRNILIAMGNSGNVRFVSVLQKFIEQDDPILSEAARWAVQQLRANSNSPRQNVGDQSSNLTQS